MEKFLTFKRAQFLFCLLMVVMIGLTLSSIFSGCTGLQIKNPVEMTNQEQALVVKSVYNRAWESYQAQFQAAPKPMSVDMKNYFQGWKKVMENAHPTIEAFCSLVEVGKTPTASQEQEIIRLILQFQTMLINKIQ